jgi:hypothetical protein
MNLVINDPATLQKLRHVQTALNLTDEAGNVIGRFIPGDPNVQTALNLTDEAGNVIGRFIPGDPIGSEPPISEEELLRLEQQTGGRHLADILADLERQHGR